MITSPPPSAPWDYIAKLVCIGDSGCGKSSLTIRLCEGRFVTHHDVTIGVEFGSRISVTRSYFRGASGALLVFDLTRKSTFQHVTDWLNDLRQIAEPDIVVVLVGNKADLTSSSTATDREGTSENKREVTRQEAEDWARRNGVSEYVETSAKSGENVEMAFMRVAERIYRNIQAGKYDLNDRRSGVKVPSAGIGVVVVPWGRGKACEVRAAAGKAVGGA
ncbi:hypothetical protein N0V88_000488 [Collariella sp. IMI 366227]|nr:hypothetical protein N0V88_000488 [Collariella sp. IMI 366227]